MMKKKKKKKKRKEKKERKKARAIYRERRHIGVQKKKGNW